MFAAIPPVALSWRRALQFAPDGSLDPDWFYSFEGSVYGGENSIDVQRIDRPSGSYDLIALSSVLEFVPDDRQAFRELLRIGSASCVLQITFVPLVETTEHSDEPRGPYGRYHDYGRDLERWFETRSAGLSTPIARAADPATGEAEDLYFFCRAAGDADGLRAALGRELPGSVVSFDAAPAVD